VPVCYLAGVPVFALQATNLGSWNVARVVQPLVYLFTLAAIQIGFGLSLAGALLALVASTCVQWLVASRLLRREGDPKGVSHRDLSAPLWRYGLASFSTTLPMALAARLDVLYLSFAVPSSELGQYAVAATLAVFVLPVSVSVGYIAFPRLARSMTDQDRRKDAWRAVAWSSVAAALGAALVIAASLWGAAWLLGPGYEMTGALASILAIGAAARGVSSTCRDVMRGLGRPAVPALAETASLIALAILLPLLVPGRGVYGGALASSVSCLVLLVGYLVTLPLALAGPRPVITS
jgi:O-antigen/teichoic acid export membrane protein